MRPDPRVVVTGLGTLGASGLGARALGAALADGHPRTSSIAVASSRRRSAGRAALVGALDLGRFIPPLVARRMSAPSRFAVAAACLAFETAGLACVRDAHEPITLATTFGPSSATQGLLDGLLDDPESASPSLFTECVANAPAAQIALHCRMTGPNHTVSQNEAGALVAVGLAAREIRSGRSTRALAGEVGEMTPLLHDLLDRFGALADQARPFDRRRSGVLAAEGASLVVLEREDVAREREAPLLARVAAAGGAFDPTASRVGWGESAAALARALRRDLGRAGLAPADVDLVVSGASGSRAGDRLEAQLLREAWAGAPLPPLVAPKSLTGEYGGAFLAAALLVAQGGACPRPADFEPDDALGLVPHAGPWPAPERVLVTSLGAGGAAAWLVLERV